MFLWFVLSCVFHIQVVVFKNRVYRCVCVASTYSPTTILCSSLKQKVFDKTGFTFTIWGYSYLDVSILKKGEFVFIHTTCMYWPATHYMS